MLKFPIQLHLAVEKYLPYSLDKHAFTGVYGASKIIHDDTEP